MYFTLKEAKRKPDKKQSKLQFQTMFGAMEASGSAPEQVKGKGTANAPEQAKGKGKAKATKVKEAPNARPRASRGNKWFVLVLSCYVVFVFLSSCGQPLLFAS